MSQAADAPIATEPYKPRIGRPRKFQSLPELEAQINAYFDYCDAQEPRETYSVTGLAVALDTNRQTLLKYQGEDIRHPEFSTPAFADTIKRAKDLCEAAMARRLVDGKGHPAGPIFALKNNHGWKDEQSMTVDIQVAHGFMLPPPTVPSITIDVLSPLPETLTPLSLQPGIAVSDEYGIAKATPIEGVSPRGVA